jgi:hypothetical protein
MRVPAGPSLALKRTTRQLSRGPLTGSSYRARRDGLLAWPGADGRPVAPLGGLVLAAVAWRSRCLGRTRLRRPLVDLVVVRYYTLDRIYTPPPELIA